MSVEDTQQKGGHEHEDVQEEEENKENVEDDEVKKAIIAEKRVFSSRMTNGISFLVSALQLAP
ncbi:hypothetical protein Patl1_25635 [Pistacia atlantica]|uniref:Uncharacterized protein n=1 Tax=Pistacia atlantica TaxID=434234 RepID=A0ACC1AZ20_9ROSI|nr:hypothetical protein Patl1_25635 [Pistacia atlantica]